MMTRVRKPSRGGGGLKTVGGAAVIGIVVLTASIGTRAHAQDSALVATARHTQVSALDSGSIGGSLEQWLSALARLPASAITWEVNDCGEGGDGLKAPTCVEANFPVASDTVGVSLIVAGLDGNRAKPEVFLLYARQGRKFVSFKALRELQAFVQARRP